MAALGQSSPWLLPNFADRRELRVANAANHAVEVLAVVPVAEAARAAADFPGTLAIVMDPARGRSPLPSQSDDLDGDGRADEFVFPVKLAAHEEREFHVYYSKTLREPLPWPKKVHASHSFGYNRSTVSLESELIGYRTYGGFFLDVQARLKDEPGLHNGLVGFLGSGAPSPAGADIIHLGDTLGLGGLFLRSGTELFRPPLNVPDYAHKPSPPEAPVYRVLAEGPLRAMVEARMDRWTIHGDTVSVLARYAIAAGRTHVECRYRITPVELSRKYEAGAGIRYLPKMETNTAEGRLALAGEQNTATGRIALGLFYDPATASETAPLLTKDDRNAAIVFRTPLTPGHAVEGKFWVAAAWSGSGIQDLLRHLVSIEQQARAQVEIKALRHTHTPRPDRLEGEAI